MAHAEPVKNKTVILTSLLYKKTPIPGDKGIRKEELRKFLGKEGRVFLEGILTGEWMKVYFADLESPNVSWGVFIHKDEVQE